MQLNASFRKLGYALLKSPLLVLKHFDEALKNILAEKYAEESSSRGVTGNLLQKANVHTRIYSLLGVPALIRHEFPSTKDIGSFMCVLGTVVKTTQPKLLECSKKYKCSVCRQKFDIDAPLEKHHAFPKKLNSCPNLCVDGKLSPIEDQGDAEGKSGLTGHAGINSKFKDYQEIKLQVQITTYKYEQTTNETVRWSID